MGVVVQKNSNSLLALRFRTRWHNSSKEMTLGCLTSAPPSSCLHEQQPAWADVPPPYAWKLHFAVLAALSTSALYLSSMLGLMRKLGVPPQVRCLTDRPLPCNIPPQSLIHSSSRAQRGASPAVPIRAPPPRPAACVLRHHAAPDGASRRRPPRLHDHCSDEGGAAAVLPQARSVRVSR